MRLLLIFMFLLFSCRTKRQEKIYFPKGGYAYLKDIPSEANGFYHYPLKNVISKRDSVLAAFYDSQFYPAFNEPNLSLRPPKATIIRYVYESGFLGYAAILTLSQGKITVKEKVTGLPSSYPDDTKLDSVERWHLNLLKRRYPLSDYNGNASRKKYYDSLLKQYPQLNSPGYYIWLMNKAKVQSTGSFTYRTWTVLLANETYRMLLDSINNSGFWHMNFRDDKCVGEATDADGYSLEVTTPEQYQMVISMPCLKSTKFELACRQLMKVSGLERSFGQYRDKARKGQL